MNGETAASPVPVEEKAGKAAWAILAYLFTILAAALCPAASFWMMATVALAVRP